MILLKFLIASLSKKAKNSKGRNIEYEIAKEKRISLLNERSLRKEEIQNIPDEGWKLEQVKNDLEKISKELARLRKTQWQDTQHRLNDEVMKHGTGGI